MKAERMTDVRAALAACRAWPVIEALKVVERVRRRPPAKGFALFETGYGPSGLPHIGTFGEVFRTTLVRRAFDRLCDVPSRLVAFSDDMDGLRKIPENVPNPERLREFLGRPLTAVPDPFGTHGSYGAHMNARLQAFLDAFGFDYSFKSATETYRSGAFDAALLKVLERHDAILEVVLPTLGPERRATYSPILPVSPRTGRVLQVPIVETRPAAGTVVFEDEDGTLTELTVTGGHCKMQWKCDWAMRWAALDVDYEMAGKDLIDSVTLSSKICRILGGVPPDGFIYELFLDEHGQKISKSKGNGISIDEWLRYGTPESLALFMFKDPRAAKRLYLDVIPRHVDDYAQQAEALAAGKGDPLANPVWHIQGGVIDDVTLPVTYGLLLNLVAVLGTHEEAAILGYVAKYAPGLSAAQTDRLRSLIGRAINYYWDFVRPRKVFRAPTAPERAAMRELADRLASLPPGTSAAAIQDEVYEVGKRHGFASLRDWFKALYEVLLGQSEGPRFGSFVELYGIAATRALIDDALDGKLAA
jgi:lysyl-tRNA synthetase class 1